MQQWGEELLELELMQTHADATQPEIQPDRLRKLLKAITNIYSPSGKELELVEYLEGYLSGSGLTLRRQKVDENRFNLIILPPGNDEPEVFFVGHLDTVTAYELEDFSYRRSGDTIFGLGTADMKAGCAAMIEAFMVLASQRRAMPSAGLALVVDEEEGNLGARELVKEYDFSWAVIGEPTDLAPCLGHYGYLEVFLRTQGKRAHSAVPEHGQNAIEHMLRLLLSVTHSISSGHQGLVYNIRELSGFPGGFVVPDACESYIDLHLPPNSRIDGLRSEFEQLVNAACKDIPGLDAELKFEETHSGYEIAHDRPMVNKLRQVYEKLSLPFVPQDFRSHSDGSVLWASGVDPIILGPGRLESAHAPEESVSFSQVVQAARLYLDFASSLRES